MQITAVRMAFVLVIGLVFSVWNIYGAQTTRQTDAAPSFIDDVRAGIIKEVDIRSLEILKFDVGGGWPFSEQEYARKARKPLSREKSGELMRLLRESSTSGHQNRNHPTTFYYGILRVDLVSGGHYYMFYQLGYYEEKYYAYLQLNPLNDPNPNHSKDYENVPLAVFLKENDPWYRNADSPTTRTRPSFPDDRP